MSRPVGERRSEEVRHGGPAVPDLPGVGDDAAVAGVDHEVAGGAVGRDDVAVAVLVEVGQAGVRGVRTDRQDRGRPPICRSRPRPWATGPGSVQVGAVAGVQHEVGSVLGDGDDITPAVAGEVAGRELRDVAPPVADLSRTELNWPLPLPVHRPRSPVSRSAATMSPLPSPSRPASPS